MIKMMIAAPASGSGKTAITCGMLALLKQMNMKVCAFKCGPDYIDPMFHRSVLGVQSCNLDLFMSSESCVKTQYERYSAGHDAAVFEGVMGYYDGVGGITTKASAWHLADVIDIPVILVIRPKGASLTLASQIKGICTMRSAHHIAGVIFNECSQMLYDLLAETVEHESGIPVLGYMPHMEEAAFESRHLGLYTAGEISELSERIDKIAVQLGESVDIKRLLKLCDVRNSISEQHETACKTACENVRIAVAKDEAFCFIYRENIDSLQDAGAQIVYFSPLHDTKLPEDIEGIYIPGGYPELYAEKLSQNTEMRKSVCESVLSGMPTVAECGGFMYLGQEIQGSDGRSYLMAGALDGISRKREKLVRFGYTMLNASDDSMLFRAGEKIPAHEFHYWDSTDNGHALQAVKPVTGRTWHCGIVSDTMYAGFPHLYFAGSPQIAERFVAAARKYRKKRQNFGNDAGEHKCKPGGTVI